MLAPRNSTTLDSTLATKLRHTPWASTTDTVPFSLQYYDVDVTLPKHWTKTLPSQYNTGSLSNYHTMSTTPQTDDWNSPSERLPFQLHYVSTSDLFQPDDDPSGIVHILHFGIHTKTIISREDAPLYFNLLDSPTCYSTTTKMDPPLIIDTGASVCITPVKSDFITYHPSKMRIKDLSSSNSVKGEGLVS